MLSAISGGEVAQVVQGPVLCVACRFHVHVARPEKNRSAHQCGHPQVRNCVDGSAPDCEHARRAGRGVCGEAAVLSADVVGHALDAVGNGL